ncbi:MAG: hypothetical protein ACTSQB_01990 [Candidatus Heimdallarchaeota archaeon]
MKSPSDLKNKSSSEPLNLAITRSRELADLIIHFAPKQPITEFTTWFTELTTINQTHPDNTEIQELLAQALTRTVRMFGERKSFADMLNILDEFELLLLQSNNAAVISEYFAEALSMAVSCFRGSWAIEGTSNLLSRLHSLVKDHSENKTVLLSYARSYSSAINRFCSNKYEFICKRLLFELRTFANKNHDDEGIQAEFAQALVYLIGTYARETRMKELHQMSDELRKIASRFPKSEKIRLLVTRAKILASLATNKKN